MRTLKQNTITDQKAVLCSIMSAPQFMNELGELTEDSKLYKSIEKLMNNQRMLNLKNL